MGMNPETNKFEALSKPDDKMAEKLAKMSGVLTDLVRPDGSPVPRTWSIFKLGELVVIKDYTFRVAYIGEASILFEPVKPSEAIEAPYKE